MFKNWNILIWEYDFLSPHWLWLLLLIPFLIWMAFYLDKNKAGDFKFSRTEREQKNLGKDGIKYIRWSILTIYIVVASLLIAAFARPFHWSAFDDNDSDYKNGIDIVIALDISGSMLAQDFLPNRLEVAKKVAKDFIKGRKGDRIGLVAYEAEAFTACPATTDYEVLYQQIDQLQSGILESGTAIGIGLGTAVTRLRNDSLPSKVIILLTDGVSSDGDISPEEAANLAKSKNIKVYTIGVGSRGMAPSPDFTPFGVRYVDALVEIDEVTLMKIAKITNGQYFRATDEASLRSIYEQINQLEKRKIKTIDYKSEPPTTPLPFLNWALVLILVAWIFQILYFKTNG